MSTYPYKSLNPARRQIRLLRIDPGSPDDGISCHLFTTSLDTCPEYDALSYVWGDANDRRSILVDGVSITVTANLHAALLGLRMLNIPGPIWADALCINQDDMDERSAQVRIMDQVYTQADLVVAWLGDEFPHLDLAMDAMARLGPNRNVHWTLSSDDDPGSGTITRDAAKAIMRLMDHPWWSRLWTIQESVLAEKLLFLCGRDGPLLPLLNGTLMNFLHHYSTCCRVPMREGVAEEVFGPLFYGVRKLTEITRSRASRGEAAGADLVDLITAFRRRQCLNPRDRVYGLLGMLEDGARSIIRPNYKKTITQVYEDAAGQLIVQSGKPKALSLVIPALRPRLPDLASWAFDLSVPDLSSNEHDLAQYRMMILELYHSAEMSEDFHGFQYHPAVGQLACDISIIGVISALGDPMGLRPVDDDKEHTARVWGGWRQLARADNDSHWPSVPDYPLRGSSSSHQDSHPPPLRQLPRSDAYWRAICGSHRYSTELRGLTRIHPTDTDQFRRSHDAWWVWLTAHRLDSDRSEEVGREYGVSREDMETFAGAVNITSSLRCFCLIDAWLGDMELFGLVPSNAEVGDTVVLIEHGRVAYVLRGAGYRDREDRAAWRFVGDAYVEGVMDGEWGNVGYFEHAVLV